MPAGCAGQTARGRARRHRVVVQAGPRAFDFLQLAETGRAEVADGIFLRCLRGVHAKLPVELFPREGERRLEPERPVGEPQVEIEAERRSLEPLEDIQVERDRVRDDLVKNFSPSSILLSHNTGASGRDTSHQSSCLSATKELTRVEPDAFS